MALHVLVGVVNLGKYALAGLHGSSGLAGVDDGAELASGGSVRAGEARNSAHHEDTRVIADSRSSVRVLVGDQRDLRGAVITALGVLETGFIALLPLQVGVVALGKIKRRHRLVNGACPALLLGNEVDHLDFF